MMCPFECRARAHRLLRVRRDRSRAFVAIASLAIARDRLKIIPKLNRRARDSSDRAPVAV